MILVHKEQGETPLEALERYRQQEIAVGHAELANVPMTYAGRLDPMAEGQLLILVGDECKDKAKYLGLDKEYEVEIVFGIETDTFDALGLAALGKLDLEDVARISSLDVSRYAGAFVQEYPPFSSKTVDGEQLHSLARKGKLPDEMPTRNVELFAVEKIGERTIVADALKEDIVARIGRVHGDFRQKEIMARWNEVLADASQRFTVLNIRVRCSSGTYMRSLAHRIGQDLGTGAFALNINRTRIFL